MNFTQSVNEVIPELGFFIGDVRTPQGINEGNEIITKKIMNSMQGLRRSIQSDLMNHDTLIVKNFAAQPLSEHDEVAVHVHKTLQAFAKLEVGLRDVRVLEAMLAGIVYQQLGKVVIWRSQLLYTIDGYDSISDNRVLRQALECKSCHSCFLPSFDSLQVLFFSL